MTKKEFDKQNNIKAIAIVIGVVLLIVACFFGSKLMTFNSANKYLNNGDYKSAVDGFEKLGSFMNADERLEVAQNKARQSSVNAIKNNQVEAGEILYLGLCDGSLIEWKAVSINDDSILLAAQTSVVNMKYGDDFLWENSEIRKYLNSTVYDNCFNDDEKEIIHHTQVYNNYCEKYTENGGNDTTDYLFLPSESEYDNFSKTEWGWNITSSDETTYRWLRGPSGTNGEYAKTLADEDSRLISEELNVYPIMFVSIGDKKDNYTGFDKDIYSDYAVGQSSSSYSYSGSSSGSSGRACKMCGETGVTLTGGGYCAICASIRMHADDPDYYAYEYDTGGYAAYDSYDYY